MAYTRNPNLPRVRRQAVELVRQGWSARKVGRYLGFHHTAVMKWVRKAEPLRLDVPILTESSRPYRHPNQLSDEIVQAILDYRKRYRRCAEVIHYLLSKDNVKVSLSSVKRTLRRNNCSRYSKWKKWHKYPERPEASRPGILVQIDSILDDIPQDRLCVYTLIDVYSRWTHAKPIEKINTHNSLSFLKEAQGISPFKFLTVQSDHGAEFSKWFTKKLLESGLNHRHSRVRTPSDNGHLERFNRTLQEECLNRIPRNLKSWRKEIPEYLFWYNTRRPHIALKMKTPIEMVPSY